MDGAINWASPRLPRCRGRIARVVERPVRLRIPDRFVRVILGGGADDFSSATISARRARLREASLPSCRACAILDLTKSPQAGMVSVARPIFTREDSYYPDCNDA
jgi:hypothetical protein